MKIAIVDNYDSFTYNLKHYLAPFASDVKVFYNDDIDWDFLEQSNLIVLSPGPGLPNKAGELMSVIEKFKNSKPILGICLGAQALAEHFDGKLFNQHNVKHGVKEEIEVTSNSCLFDNTSSPIYVGLYHSWAIDEKSITNHFDITSKTKNGVVMSFQHKKLNLTGIQFHPESVLTEQGKQMIRNYMNQL